MPSTARPNGHPRLKRSRSWPAVKKGHDEDDVERRGSVDISHDNQIVRAGWKALFSFTTKKHLSTLVAAILLSIASGIVIPALAQFLGKFFNLYSQYGAGTISKSEFLGKSRVYAIGLVGLAAGSFILNGTFYMLWITFGELQAKSARERLFAGLLVKELEWYDMRKHGIGALIPRMQTQIRELEISVSQPFGTLIEHVVTACASLGLAFYNSWKLTLVTISTVPLAAVFLAYYSAKTQTQIERQIEHLTRAAKIATTSFTAIETVKCFNGEDSEVFKYDTVIRKAAGCYLLQAHFGSLQMGFLKVFTLGMFVQGFWYGTSLLDHGTSAGQIMTTFMAALSATEAIQGILPQLLILEKGRTAGATLRVIMTNVEKAQDNMRSEPAKSPETCRGEVVAQNVSFAYPTRPSNLALNDASFFFPAGQTVFIIGRSGSGKSTVGQLLMRFYDASSGVITVDGLPLQKVDVKWIRSNITLVEQQSTLFQDTMFLNIALGKRNYNQVSEEEVRQAADFALLQQTINDLPDGLTTLVGPKGNSMSGGQRQRMAIARARLRDTAVLILDESTSALDYITRTLVLDAIRTWRRAKTTIIITHDISQLGSNDYAYVMDRGRVVQQGYRKEMESLPSSAFSTFAPRLGDSNDLKDQPPPIHPSRGSPRRSLSLDSSQSVYDEAVSEPDSMDSLALRFDHNPAARVPYMSPALISRFATRPMSIGPLSPTGIPVWRTITAPIRSAASSDSDTSVPQVPMSIRAPPPPKDNAGPSARASTDLVAMAGVAAMDNRLSSLRSRRSGYTEMSRRTKSASLLLTPGGSQLAPRKQKNLTLDAYQQTDREQRAETLGKILKTVWPTLNWTGRLSLVFGFVAATIVAVSTPLFSYVFSQLLATFYIADDRSKKALKWSVVVLGIACADAVATYLMGMLLQYCGQLWVDRTRLRAMRRIFEQPRDFFDKDTNAVSRLADNLDRNAEEMRGLVSRFIGFSNVAIVMITFALSWSLIICWKLTLVALSAGPFMYGVSVGFERVSGVLEGRSNDAAEKTGTIFTETFTNIKTVRALTLEEFFRAKHTKATDHALRVGLKRAIYAGFFFGLSETGVILINALVFYYGSRLVGSGEFTVKKILEVFSLLLFTITTVNSIVGYIPQMSSARDTASRLLRLARLPQDSYESYGNARVPSIGTITFTDVSFAYPSRPDNMIMRNLNLTIPSGAATAIVGSSGSGKSTIAALLLNLYTTGPIERSAHAHITLAGRDIRRVHTPTLRSLVSIVAQTPTLFPCTIAENITYGLRPESPYRKTASTRDAAIAAGIDEFIMSLPNGYETPIGEGGIGLSGGQAQRIAIARALVRQPRVLILDEATSALDVESAGIIRDSIQRLIASGKRSSDPMTVIIITHSKEMMRIAEKIIMLDHGTVVEEGGFEELVEKRGEFYRLLKGGALDDTAEVQ